VTTTKTKTPSTGFSGGRGVTKVKTKKTSTPASKPTGRVSAKSTTVTKTKRPVGKRVVVKSKETTTKGGGEGYVTSGRKKQAKGSLTTSKGRMRVTRLKRKK
jgi:hypothetical protein